MINWEFLIFFVGFFIILFSVVSVNWKKIEPVFKKLSEQNKKEVEKITGKRTKITKRLMLNIIVIFSVVFLVLVVVTYNLETKERIFILGPILVPVVVGIYKYIFGKLPN